MAIETDKRKYLQPEMVAMLNSMALRARLVVEGYIIGQHRSPYHGFSVEFAEHRAYGPGAVSYTHLTLPTILRV